MYQIYYNIIKHSNLTKNFSRCLSHGAKLHSSKLNNSLFSYRTHTCGELTNNHIGQNVILCGWIHSFRGNKFMLLRDFDGIVQILVENQNVTDTGKDIFELNLESVLKLSGQVVARVAGQENLNMQTGLIEVIPKKIQVLNESKLLPFQIKKSSRKLEPIRHQYRYLDIRTEKMQHNLRLRSKLISDMRNSLERNHFIEVETPILFRLTPGGAQEFVVPSSTHSGKFYCLPQSPQQLKQLLMVGGIDRYYQVAKCFRDEASLADRQLEFTQLDLEMSFAKRDDVIACTELMIKSSWPCKLPDEPFPLITYQDAMDQYGTDKPDTRFDMKLHDISHVVPSNLHAILDSNVVRAIKLENCAKWLTNKFKDSLSKSLKSVCQDHANYSYLSLSDNYKWKTSPSQFKFISDLIDMEELIDTLQMSSEDVAIISWGSKPSIQNTLGQMRLCLFDLFQKFDIGYPFKEGHHFVWVVDFPMFEKNSDGCLQAVHHPFTAPVAEDLSRLESDPLSVRSLAYDLVLNGQEVGGGSIRIHNAALQRQIFDMLQLNTTDLFYLFEALESGAPPHGGIALGIDRIVAILCGADNIRNVIAFPKNSTGVDTMVNAPCKISNNLKAAFHITTSS